MGRLWIGTNRIQAATVGQVFQEQVEYHHYNEHDPNHDPKVRSAQGE